MNKKLILICLTAALTLGACKKLSLSLPFKKDAEEIAEQQAADLEDSRPQSGQTAAAASTGPAPAGSPAPANATAPAPAAATADPAVDKSAGVMVLCYHNIEDQSAMKALTITTTEFERQLQAIKDNGFTVIGMQDFLAWRRGEKTIPAKSCLITIDDGWVSGYTNAWPILKKFGYPFTLFIYVNYVNSGGKSLTWDQLAEMRDGGVDIQSHTYSHSNLKAPGVGVDRRTAELVRADVAALGRDGWLRKEIIESKNVLEKQLGIKVNALAYPFGIYSNEAREVVKEAGYEAAFTVYGQRLGFSQPPFDLLGRYAVEASKPQIFQAALSMVGGGVTAGAGGPPVSAVAQVAAASMVTQPMEGETIRDPKPLIKANVATMGAIDKDSIEMRVSGLGVVPAKFDPATKIVSYQVPTPLRDKSYTVILSAKSQGKKLETRWTFNFEAGGAAR